MMAVLRHMYELPFVDCHGDDCVLQDYAKIYIAADKYQVNGLKLAISDKMKHIVETETCRFTNRRSDSGFFDFVYALKTIVKGTTTGDLHAREVMVKACVANLRYIHKEPEFLSLLMESADLGAAIIGHKDFEYGAGGAWETEGECRHHVLVVCPHCGAYVEEDIFERRKRGKRG